MLGSWFLLLSLGITFQNCKKDDAPSFKDQLVGHWESVEVKLSGANLTASNKFILHLQETREFDLDYTTTISGAAATISSSGDWQENEEKLDVVLTYNGSGQEVTYEVVELTETQLQVEYTQDGGRYSIKFKRTE